jgi:hypothetical protein
MAGDEWSASRLCRFIPEETALGTHWIGGWVGPRAGLDDVGLGSGFYFLKQISNVGTGRGGLSPVNT